MLVKTKKPAGLQSGFTLIELMISISIGVILLLAATGMVVSTAESRRAVKHTAALQDESFFVSHVLKQQLAQAGYRPLTPATGVSRSIPIASRFDHFPAVSGVWQDGQLIRATANSLTYRFDGASRPDGTPDGSIFDCLGNAIPAGTIVESTISHIDDRLVCTVGANSAALMGGSTDTRVEQMMITLGIDNNGDGEIDNSVDSSLATVADFQNTINLTLRVLLASRNNVIKHNQSYYFNGATTATDHRLRTESVVSIGLRH
ncbi:MAG: prepilin-type N-terminal cleavage/methylation domain-containing protein [Pseudomonadota bacterium]